MKPDAKKIDLTTKCQYAVNFHYNPANKGSEKTSCRNVPIICGLCPPAKRKQDSVPAVWRYNMPQHLKIYHSEYASPLQPEGIPLPFAVWENMAVSREEEEKLGVKEFLIPPPFAKVAPAVEVGSSAQGENLKRGTESQAGNKGKKARVAKQAS